MNAVQYDTDVMRQRMEQRLEDLGFDAQSLSKVAYRLENISTELECLINVRLQLESELNQEGATTKELGAIRALVREETVAMLAVYLSKPARKMLAAL